LSPLPDRSALGLRERKKAQMRETIQSFALQLMREQGYAATTVEQIITGVDVSESTFFRYFPTKESLVLSDEFDPIILEAFLAQPNDISVMSALRNAMRSLFAGLSAEALADQRERVNLVVQVPSLRSAMLDQFSETMTVLSRAIAERTDRAADDFVIRVVAGAVIGAAMAILTAMADDPSADIAELMDRAMEQLEGGLSV
jgi:AcrR family transcriptional regulator